MVREDAPRFHPAGSSPSKVAILQGLQTHSQECLFQSMESALIRWLHLLITSNVDMTLYERYVNICLFYGLTQVTISRIRANFPLESEWMFGFFVKSAIPVADLVDQRRAVVGFSMLRCLLQARILTLFASLLEIFV
jgi:hypothetical protein